MQNDERQQMNQRYNAGKVLDGASLEEIANGIVNPVEEMNYITGTNKQGTSQSPPTRQLGANQTAPTSVLRQIGNGVMLSIVLLAALVLLYCLLGHNVPSDIQ